jgi:hypothetical protein
MDDIEKTPLAPEDPTEEQQQSEKQRGRPFQVGQSGNPKGRPKGSRNKTTLLAEALLEGDAEAILRKLLEKAKEGDPTALRLCADRLLPARRDRPVVFDLDEIKNPDDIAKASGSVLAACAEGTLSPDEAGKIMNLIAAHQKNMLQLGSTPQGDPAQRSPRAWEAARAKMVEGWRRGQVEENERERLASLERQKARAERNSRPSPE